MATAPAELIDIATRHQLHYERLKSHEVKAFDNFLIELSKDLRQQLSKSDITDFTRARLEKQLQLVRETVHGTYEEYKERWTDSLMEAGKYEAEFEKKALDQVVINNEFVLPTEGQIKQAAFGRPLSVDGINGGSLLDQFFDDELPYKTIKRVEGAIRMGFAQGQTNQQVIQRIIGTRKAKYTDGIMALSRRDAGIVVRTSMQHMSSQARRATWEVNSDIVNGVRIVATLDSKTTTICRSLDGKIYPIEKAPMPPFHLNCRTTTSPALDSRFSILDEGATRSSRDEDGDVVSVDANETYYSWLKKQTPDFQDSVIGKKRGKLLRDGGLTADRFAELQLGKNFEPLTLKEIRAIEPLAFEKAGL